MTTTTTKTFEQAYADAIIPEMTDEQWKEASKERQLHWHGETMPLADAAELYSRICGGYNEFKPDMLAKLQAEFPNAGIEVTPAREGSVAVYLHIPEDQREAVGAFASKTFEADEVDVVDRFSCLQKGEPELVGEALRIWWD